MKFLKIIVKIMIISLVNLLIKIRCQVINSATNVTNDNATEIQYTNCRITTEKLTADAEATVSRVLIGGCTAKLIDERFSSLENILNDQLNELNSLIHQIIDSNNQVDFINSDKKIFLREELFSFSPRQKEIDEFNNTLTEIPETNEKIFIYYWKVDNIKQKFSSWKTGIFERSNTFYIKNNSYGMYIKFTPKYFPDGTIFISIGLTKGCYDDHLHWPFSYKLQLEVLDHSPEPVRRDRKSRSWDPSSVCPTYFWERPLLNDNPECVGMSITRYFLTNKYLWNDSLYMKLTVYL